MAGISSAVVYHHLPWTDQRAVWQLADDSTSAMYIQGILCFPAPAAAFMFAAAL